MNTKRVLRGPVAWVAMAMLATLLVLSFSTSSSYAQRNLSTVQDAIAHGEVASAVLHERGQHLDLTLKSPDGKGKTKISADFATDQTQPLAALLHENNISYKIEKDATNPFLAFLLSVLPIALLLVLFLFFMNSMQGGGNRVMSFGKSKAKMVNKDLPKTTFADVAGADEAVEELQEIKEFLAEPAKFQAVGAKIPKGVLLYGPPGTGKTLLARAVAGEANVPFYSISGSDFVEMFVGVGASRVRDLFEQAKANAPAIVFVDEIDAVGRHRGAGLGGGHDEREQTLNQLLVEMDGFDVKGGVILIAATNRPDILDPALLRPGRFDRQIAVDRPDLQGRKAILGVHAKGKPMGGDVELEVIARRTPGFTGADLANVLNEAALLTARQGATKLSMHAVEEAIDRVIGGPERRTRVMNDKEKKVTAYHEAGHALVASAMPHLDPVHKVTVLPRGRSLGHTLVLPTEDRYTQTRGEMIDHLAYAMGGRAAEELVFHEPTTGAANDIEQATAIARAMVTQYGMSDNLGALKYGQEAGEVFLGRDMGHQRDYSEDVARLIDEEVRGLVENAHNEAFNVLVEHRDLLDELVLRLLERETIGRDELAEIFKDVRKVAPRPAHTGSGKRKPSSKPPVLTPSEVELLGEGDLKAIRRANARRAPAKASSKTPTAVRRVAGKSGAAQASPRKPARKPAPRRRSSRGGATEPGA